MARVNPVVWVVLAFVLLALIALNYVTGTFWAPSGFLLVPGFILLLVLGNLALIVASIVHALTRPDLTGPQRIIWVLVCFFVVPIVALGAIVYFALGRARTRDLFRDVTFGGAAPPAPPAGP